jgi:hypothetical protein
MLPQRRLTRPSGFTFLAKNGFKGSEVQGSDDRGQMTDDRSQRSEDRRQSTDVEIQRSDYDG